LLFVILDRLSLQAIHLDNWSEIPRPPLPAAVKNEAQQAAAMGYGTGNLLVRQRTWTINASCRRHAFRRRAGGTPSGVSRRHASWHDPEARFLA
jgi:hypothetical protein